MAGQNDFLIFDENNENILTQANYASDTDRANGFRTGLARSIVTNKVLHQTSMVCHALGELAKDNDQVATDTGNVSELKTALKNALGGADINLSNLSATGQAKFDAKVSKSGDTMSGNLTISKSNPSFIVKDSRIDFTTNPSSNIFSVFSALKDANNVSVGEVWHEYRTDGSHAIYFQSRKSATNNDTYSTLKVGWDGSGTKYCEFPNTKCCDGQWVDSHHVLSTSTAKGNYQIDISSYLPSDRTSYDYEVMVAFGGGRSGGGANSFVSISDTAVSLTAGTQIATNPVYGFTEFDGDHGEAGQISCIVIARKNNDKFYFNISNAAITGGCLIMTKYRRIGTNA